MINPYFSYAFSFTISILAYGLGWSLLYPPLSLALIGFLVFTIALHLSLSFYWKSTIAKSFPPVDSFFNPVIVTVFLYILWTADFVYEGGVPLIKILFDQPYNYRLFGVPSLHVFTVTFGSFFTVYLFSLYVYNKERKYLILYLVNLFAALLIYSRAMMLFNIIATCFVYFMISPSFSFKRIALMATGIIILVYFFGVLGNIRVSFEAKEKYNPDLFLEKGKVSERFLGLRIPKEFFWGYIYLSSPVANLQQNINTFQVPPFSEGRMAQHLYNEMSFDFVSKRINRLLGTTREIENTLPKTPFNVSTVYSRSFSYQAWLGMFMIALFVLVVPLIYVKYMPVNRYQLTGLAILNTMYLFLFYDNTIRFTGLGLQLVYPFLLPLAERSTLWLQKKIAL